MFSSDPPQKQNHFRFYIVMATLVIGGIFFFLLMNNEDSKLTSAVVGTTEDAIEEPEEFELSSSSKTSTLAPKNAKEVDVKVDFSEVPVFRKKTSVNDITLRFTDVTSQINVNNDRLELHNLNNVELEIEGFQGEVSLDNAGISLSGTARKVIVNGIVLASAKDIKISFGKIAYDYADFDQLSLTDISYPQGSGELTVEERLRYELQNEQFTLYNFGGRITLDRSGTSLASLIGTAKGIDLSGEVLSLGVR